MGNKGQQNNHCPYCNGSLVKSESKVCDLCLTTWLLHATRWASKDAHQYGNRRREHKQGGNSEKELKKDKVGRNTWYIPGRSTSDKDYGGYESRWI